MEKHPIIHIEIPAKDPFSGSQWYADVFGWKLSPMPEMDYVTFEAEGGPAGGFPRIDGNMYHPKDITVYIDTNDVDATVKRIEEHGGKLLLPKSPIPGMGWFALFEDPSGNRMGVFTVSNPPPAG